MVDLTVCTIRVIVLNRAGPARFDQPDASFGRMRFGDTGSARRPARQDPSAAAGLDGDSHPATSTCSPLPHAVTASR